MQAGNLYLNRGITGALVERQPFGGYKLSGIGTKAGGPDYLLQFLIPINVTENTLRRGFAPPSAKAKSRHRGPATICVAGWCHATHARILICRLRPKRLRQTSAGAAIRKCRPSPSRFLLRFLALEPSLVTPLRRMRPSRERTAPPSLTRIVDTGPSKKCGGQKVPAVHQRAAAQTPIDASLLARLAEKTLSFSPPADKPTLMRRASFWICMDFRPARTMWRHSSPTAQPTRCPLRRSAAGLAAFWPAWGRHWLDVVGYADTVGFDTDANSLILSDGKWKYRDYVIAAFNADEPSTGSSRNRLPVMSWLTGGTLRSASRRKSGTT